MNAKHLHVAFVLILALSLASCSGLNDSGGGGGGGTGNAVVSITMFDTPPAGVTPLSFTLPIAGISLTPSSGSNVAVATAVGSVEATRLQTDSVLLVDGASVTPGTYTGLNVTLGPTSSTTNVFVNTSGSSVTYGGVTCPNDGVCYLPAGAIATISIPISLTLTANQSQWIGLDLNLNNAITTTSGLTVDFTQSGVLTATTTVRTGLPSGAVDTIEDFTGVVTALSSSSITVQNGINGYSLTATLNSGTEYDTPISTSGTSYNACTANTAQTCLAVGSTVSVDANLASSGTLTATEVDVLDAKEVDELEGVIYPTSTANVYGLVVADKVSQSGNAILGASSTSYGTAFLLTATSLSNFAIDVKTLSPSITSAPIGFEQVSDILAGQQVRVQVSNVASSTTNGVTTYTATATNMALRFSRMTGTATNTGSTSFNFAPPSYIATLDTSLVSPLAYLYTSTLYDGTTSNSGITSSTVAIRALFLNNNLPTFAVAKVRIPQ
jgi:hypothetical protein